MPPTRDGAALLVPLLGAGRPLLLAGAGASSVMGYPLWGDFVRELAQEFAPALALSGDYLANVDRISDTAERAGRADEYFKRLDRAFSADGASRRDLRFHRRLISLGFSGLITTNFDPTLEHACSAASRSTLGTVDLISCTNFYAASAQVLGTTVSYTCTAFTVRLSF